MKLFEDESLVTESYVEQLADKMGIPEEDVTSMDASILAGIGNAASPVFKGIPDFRPIRIKMLRADTVKELNEVINEIKEKWIN